jgi:hypothetical protein
VSRKTLAFFERIKYEPQESPEATLVSSRVVVLLRLVIPLRVDERINFQKFIHESF